MVFGTCWYNRMVSNTTQKIYYIHAYIHNRLLKFFSQACDLASHTTYVVCVNFYKCVEGPTYINSEWQILDKLYISIFFTLKVFARNLLRGSRLRNIFIFPFWYLMWGINPRFTSNSPHSATRLCWFHTIVWLYWSTIIKKMSALVV